MTEQAIESIAVPVIEQAAKTLEPQAAQLLEEFRQFAFEKEQKLAADLHQLLAEHHTGLLGWLVDRLSGQPASAPAAPSVDPTPAAPAPQS